MKPLKLSRLWPWLLLGLVALVGCAPVRIGVSWTALETVQMNGKTKIVATFDHFFYLLDPDTGILSRLTNTEGEVRLDEAGNPRTWSIDGTGLENAQFFARPIVSADGLTFTVAAYNNRILKIDAPTARIDDAKGHALPGATITDMAMDENNYYVALKLGGVVALDRETFETQWSFTSAEGVWASPLLVDGVLYVGTVEHNLYAFDAATGNQVWEQALDLEGLIGAAPLYHDGFLYVGSYNNTLYKVTTAGEIAGRYTTQNWVWSTPTLYDGVLYVSDLAGYVHAVDPATMDGIWSVKAATRGIRPAPLVTEDLVVVASRDGKLYWLDRTTGAPILDREVEGRPEMLADLLLLEADEASGIRDAMVIASTVDRAKAVVAFDLRTGQQRWVYSR